MSDIPRISPEEARILGCLIEKQITTPEYYPLTLNALVLACNQKSNRNPVVSYDQELVTYYLDSLRDRHMAALVSEAGARVPKYKHTVSEVLHLDPGEMAVLCELLLRGPQTPGELRSRAMRMSAFQDLAQVEAMLDNLATYPDGPLAAKLPRLPGTKESRFCHLLCGPTQPGNLSETAASKALPSTRMETADEVRLQSLEVEIAELRQQLQELSEAFQRFKQQFE